MSKGHDVVFLFVINILDSMYKILKNMKKSNSSYLIVPEDVVKYCRDVPNGKDRLWWVASNPENSSRPNIQELERKIEGLLTRFKRVYYSEIDSIIAKNFQSKIYSKVYDHLTISISDSGKKRNDNKWRELLSIINLSKNPQLNENQIINNFMRTVKFELCSLKEMGFIIKGGVYATSLALNMSNMGHLANDIIKPDARDLIVASLIPFYNLRNMYRFLVNII